MVGDNFVDIRVTMKKVVIELYLIIQVTIGIDVPTSVNV